MLSVITHRFPLFKKKEIWFYDGENVKEEAYTTYCYVTGSFPKTFDHKLEEYTTIIDLNQSEKILYNSISKTFRYHIRKAGQYGFLHESSFKPTIAECEKLVAGFNQFAALKKITPINKKRIFALQRSGNLVITRMLDGEAEIVKHVYLFDQQRVVLLHTFHDLTNEHPERGFANKYLHWKDILLFKKSGLKIYDFGGIDLQKVPGISRFKLSYGGRTEAINSYTRIAGPLKLFFRLYKKLNSRP